MDTIHTDNESVFKGAAFKEALAKLGIQLTHPLPSAPAENGRVEKLARRTEADFLKQLEEWQDRGNKPLSLDAFTQELKKFIDDYNSRLAGGSPPAAD